MAELSHPLAPIWPTLVPPLLPTADIARLSLPTPWLTTPSTPQLFLTLSIMLPLLSTLLLWLITLCTMPPLLSTLPLPIMPLPLLCTLPLLTPPLPLLCTLPLLTPPLLLLSTRRSSQSP